MNDQATGQPVAEANVGGSIFGLLTPEQVCHELGVSNPTLARWRMEGRGPDWVKVGQAVRYPIDSLRAYIEAQRRGSMSAEPDDEVGNAAE